MRSLYSNKQRKVDTPGPVTIPSSSMPALLVPTFGGGVVPPTPRHTPAGIRAPKTPFSKFLPSLMMPELGESAEDKLLGAFYCAEPFSLEATDLIHDIVDGYSDLFKFPMKRQIALLYKVFQHCWVKSLREFIFQFIAMC